MFLWVAVLGACTTVGWIVLSSTTVLFDAELYSYHRSNMTKTIHHFQQSIARNWWRAFDNTDIRKGRLESTSIWIIGYRMSYTWYSGWQIYIDTQLNLSCNKVGQNSLAAEQKGLAIWFKMLFKVIWSCCATIELWNANTVANKKCVFLNASSTFHRFITNFCALKWDSLLKEVR